MTDSFRLNFHKELSFRYTAGIYFLKLLGLNTEVQSSQRKEGEAYTLRALMCQQLKRLCKASGAGPTAFRENIITYFTDGETSSE